MNSSMAIWMREFICDFRSAAACLCVHATTAGRTWLQVLAGYGSRVCTPMLKDKSGLYGN